MTQSRKIRVAVLYGGRSGEHEVSLQSAASVIRNLDASRFEVTPIAIDKQGRWLLSDAARIQKAQAKALTVYQDAPELQQQAAALSAMGVDVVFPAVHGTNCEDGTLQGMLELAGIAYVGCGVLASAVGMDKDVAKRVARDAGLPIVPFVTLRGGKFNAEIAAKIASELGFPVFVKPANSGSSVGVHKVKQAAQLEAAVRDAFRYDTKVLVERAIDAREIEFSVLENPKFGEAPLVSVPGEIAPTHEFYSYEAKYLDENGAAVTLPAKLTPEQLKQGRELAGLAFAALECEGMARVDLFLDRDSGQLYLNEINTLPGFTSISMYPKMWEAAGIPYKELLTKLIELGLARHDRKSKLLREFTLPR